MKFFKLLVFLVFILSPAGSSAQTADAEKNPEASVVRPISAALDRHPASAVNPGDNSLEVPQPVSPLKTETETYDNGKIKRQSIIDPKTGEEVLKKYSRNGVLLLHSISVNGKREGPYREYYENGQLAVEFNYFSGVEHGPYARYYPTGILKEKGEYSFGNGQGLFTYYYENGQLSKEVTYKDGQAEGKARTYFPDGTIATEDQYAQGQPAGLCRSYFANGQLKDAVHYENGQRNGEFSVFDENGHLKGFGHFENDALAGTVVAFYENGIMQSAIDYAGGKVDGYAREYYPNGLLKTLDNYKNGIVGQQIKYDEKGNQVKDQVYLIGNIVRPTFDVWHFGLAGIAFIFGILLAIFLFRLFAKKRNPSAASAWGAQWTQKPEDVKPGGQPKGFNLLHAESEKMYRHMVETVTNGLFLADAKGRLNYVNFAFAQIMGFSSKTDVIGSNIKDFFRDEKEEFWKRLQEKNVVKDYILNGPAQEGKELFLSVSANLLWDDKGVINGMEGVVNDITIKHKLEEEIYTEKRKMERIFEFYEKIDTVRDLQVLANFTVEEISNILEAKRCSMMLLDEKSGFLTILAAKGISEYVIANTQIKIGEEVSGQVALKGEALLVKNVEYDKRFARGKLPYYLGRSFMVVPLWVHDKLAGVINVADKNMTLNPDEPFSDTDFKILRIMGKRISTALENVSLFKELNLQTVTDPLTQIYNYRLFSESLDQEIRRQKRNKTDLCVSMIDMDHFKSYNDAYGHVAGDELLRTFGEMLKSNLRDTDIVCRYAGDEFCVVFPNTHIHGAQLAAEKVRKVVEAHPFKQQITLSIGIAQYRAGMSKQDLILKADEALYKAKKDGRNRVVVARDES